MGTNKNTKIEIKCNRCGQIKSSRNFYQNISTMYAATEGHIPICRDCLIEIYEVYYKKYDRPNIVKKQNVEKKALDRMCMMFNIYYSDKIYNSVVTKFGQGNIVTGYFKILQLHQHKGKTYDTTIDEKEAEANLAIECLDDDVAIDDVEIPKDVIKRFGAGFSNADYLYLQEQYEDWTTRHECQTKAQEEVFKRICFKQLEIHKATLKGEDTKDLDATFQKLLDTAKLQPKQNAADTLSQAQTFGTLIEKYETTRPLPEIDEELRDIDKIGLYLDVFFKGHLAKVMGLKNGISELYEKFIKKYSVEKTDLDTEEDTELLFDTLFGSSDLND